MYHNVLPEEIKKSLHSEYRGRLATVSLFATAFVFFIAGAALMPVLILVITKEGHVSSENAALIALRSSGDGVHSATIIADTQAKLVILEAEDSAYQPSVLFSRIFAARPAGISILAIRFDKSKGSSLIVEGVAGTRATLVEFQKSIEKTEPFTKADLPIGTLAKSTGAPFTITVSGDF